MEKKPIPTTAFLKRLFQPILYAKDNPTQAFITNRFQTLQQK